LLAKLFRYRSFFSSRFILCPWHSTRHANLGAPSYRQLCLLSFSSPTAAPFAECMFTAGPSDDKPTNIVQCCL
jgi:hypothetical protein